MPCEVVSDRLADVAAGRELLDGAGRRHVEQCLRCQAEVVQYRKLFRAMRALRSEVIDPTPGLVADVLAAIEEMGDRRALHDLLAGRRAAYLGGLAAATAAAGGALALAARSRRLSQLAG